MDMPANGKALDVKRGLFRLWVLISSVWIMGAGAIYYQTAWLPMHQAAIEQQCFAAKKDNPSLGNPFDCFDTVSSGAMFADLIPTWPTLGRFIAIGAGFPILTMGLFLVGSWVVRGFVSKPK